MESTAAGSLVKVATGGAQIDGIVFDVPSASKVVVAVMDRARGPVLRTVELKALSERTEAGDDDRALQLLVRRTAPASRGTGRSGGPSGSGRTAHTRGAAHRPTGR
jgi:hypothetical protein